MKVLVVDDNQGVLDLCRLALEVADHSVTTATDGHKGIREIERHAFDVVILDIIMPVKEGIETLMEIRERWPEQKVIAISGAGGSMSLDMLEAARKFGATDVLQKPFTDEQLIEKVGEYAPAALEPKNLD